MSLLNVLGGSPLLSLIGWTVVSAFTLGAAAAALVLLCRGVAPRLTAAWQHRLVLVLYALSLACAFAIAAVPRKPPSVSASTQPVLGLPVADAVIPAPPGPSALTTNISRVDMMAAVQDAAGVLGLLAIGLGVVALARLCAGLWIVGRLKRNAVPIADADVLAMVDSLAGRMRIRRRITLRDSAEVDTAMTGGWLRPFVLLPPGMAATLGSEIEPVLAHELAHVRRRDFAVAVVQSIADAGTRLSPGHRWLSLEASRVREQACDDVVVALGVEPLRYARALEALGKWSRGVHVTDVVCAANRHLADRVRRLLEGSASSPRGIAVAGAVLALFVGAAGTTLVAVAAPGLPNPPSDAHLPIAPPVLMSGLDAVPTAHRKSATSVAYYYDPQAPGPFRVSTLTSHNDDTIAVTIQCVYPKRIVALALGREARRTPALSPGDQFVERSAVVKVVIDPGKSASALLVFPPITLSSLFMGPRAEGSRVQVQYYPAYARFDDGTEWSGGPAVARLLTIPRALVSTSAHASSSPADRIWICYDAEGHETSEGGLAPIREDETKWVRCTNGRWVPTTLPVPADAKVTLPIR
jgi:beta-lactamase regulating signal transducer with metallopeptidase domain